MTARCEKTDLLIGECGDTCCRPDLTPARYLRSIQEADAEYHRGHVCYNGSLPGPTVRVTFTARYDSPCDHCEGRIKTDEPMGLDRDGNKVCERCLP